MSGNFHNLLVLPERLYVCPPMSPLVYLLPLFCVEGESVTVTVCSREEDTAALLAKVLDGDQTAAALLTRAIHQDLQLRDQAAEALQLDLIPADVGIWIDPIGNRRPVLLTTPSTKT